MADACFCRLRQRRGDHDRLGKEGCHHEPAYRPRRKQCRIVWCGGGRDIPCDEHAEKTHDQRLPRESHGEQGQNRPADHHAQRIRRHQMTRGRDRDGEIRCDFGQEARDHELGRRNGEGTQRERQYREQRRRVVMARALQCFHLHTSRCWQVIRGILASGAKIQL